MNKRVFIVFAMAAAVMFSACSKNKSGASDMLMEEKSLQLYDDASYNMRAAAEPYTTTEPPAPAMGAFTEAETASGDMPDQTTEKRIRTGNLSFETIDFDDAELRAAELAAESGGYVESSNQYRNASNLRRADYVLRVPAEGFNAVMSGLSGLGRVTATGSSEQDVTEQYYDITARLSAKEAEEARLLELIALAENLNDLILLESRLSTVRSDIEHYKSRQAGIDRKASFSTIYLNIIEATDVYDADSLWGRVREAFGDSLDGVALFFQGLLVFIVSAAVPFLIIAAAALVGFIVFRRLMKRRRKKE
ncbi:MAG: DUF4349 domain-containing protein [Clostridiales bacterium]|jgi:hypothetical protein|nr:DUF4349 domain-containing protein [Clostridiales bacterium]